MVSKFSASKKYKIAAVVLITILFIILIGCSSEQKYTYEEYKKIKFIEEGKESESISEPEEGSSNQEELQSYYDDLNDYNSYMKEFKLIYDKYTNELLTLFDNFDNEQQDLDKKNQYANSIIDYEEKWIADLNELEVPDLLKEYSSLFIDSLNNEILFYTNFLEADIVNADISEQEASGLYEKSSIELKAVKESFNDRAKKLNLDPPF